MGVSHTWGTHHNGHETYPPRVWGPMGGPQTRKKGARFIAGKNPPGGYIVTTGARTHNMGGDTSSHLFLFLSLH